MPAANMITHDFEAGRLYLERATPLTLESLRSAICEALKLAMDYQRDIGAWEYGGILKRAEPRMAVRLLDVQCLQPLRDALEEYRGHEEGSSIEENTQLHRVPSASDTSQSSLTNRTATPFSSGTKSEHEEHLQDDEKSERSATPLLPSQREAKEKALSTQRKCERDDHSVASVAAAGQVKPLLQEEPMTSFIVSGPSSVKLGGDLDSKNLRFRESQAISNKKRASTSRSQKDILRRREVMIDALELMTIHFQKLHGNDNFVPNARTRDIVWRLLKALKGMPGCSNYNTPDRALRRRLLEAGQALWSCIYPNNKCAPKIAGIGLQEGVFTFISWATFVGICIFFGVPFVTQDVISRSPNEKNLAWATAGWTVLAAFLMSIGISVSRLVRHRLNLRRLRKEVMVVAHNVVFEDLYEYLHIKERVRRSVRFQVMTHTWEYLGMEGATIRRIVLKKIVDARDFAFNLVAASIAVLVIEFMPFGEDTFSNSKIVGETIRRGIIVGRVYSFLIILVFIISLMNYGLLTQLIMVVPSDPNRLPMILGVVEDLQMPFLWITSLANSGSLLIMATAAYLIAVVNFKVGRLVSAVPIAIIIALFYMFGSRVRWLHAQVKLDEVDLD